MDFTGRTKQKILVLLGKNVLDLGSTEVHFVQYGTIMDLVDSRAQKLRAAAELPLSCSKR